MPRLVIATSATDTPMGAQHYQESIASRAVPALGTVSDRDWDVERTIARSLRSDLPGTVRLPMTRIRRAGLRERALLGRAVYPRRAVVHRMDLTLPPPPGPEVVTLHDVVGWTFPDEEDPPAAAAAELRRADAVICVSEFTASEATALLGLQDPVVIPNGVDEPFFNAIPLPLERRRQLGIDDAFVLYAGGSSERKNLAGLAEAWRAVGDRLSGVQLVLAGPRSASRDKLFAGLEDVVHVGRVDDDILIGMVAAATAVVVPSRYEGFGLPALEAMAAGAPLVCANTSSLPEVVGDAALLCEPTGAALADAMHAVVLAEVDTQAMVARGRLRAQEFTWRHSAERHARVWDSLR